jgi:hypothetical protein
MFRPALRFTLALLLPLQSMQSGHSAESTKLEASYIVFGEQGMVAQTILTNAAQCPMINLDGNLLPMNVRASPGGIERFPDLVCEFFIPAGTNIAAINGQALPLLHPTLGSIAVLGDSGCRLRAVKIDPTDSDEDDGKFQDCNIGTQWPFSVLAKSAAASATTSIVRALAGHIHLWEVLSFADQRSPQFVLGNSGTLLAHKIKQPLIGQQIQNATISFGRSEHEWGYTLFRRGADETNSTATYYGINGDPKFSCRVSATAVSC